MKKLRKLYLNITLIFEQKKEIKRQNQILNEEIKKEMDNLEIEKKEIIQEKEESIKKLEIEKTKLIKEDDKKFTEILSYLDSIKNDRNKLIEFLSRKKIFWFFWLLECMWYMIYFCSSWFLLYKNKK